jgi:hypothetical protein
MDERKTVFLSRLRRGEQLKGPLYSWEIEKYDGREIEGVPENKDADGFETNKQYRLWNRSMKFWRRPHVTVEANQINVAPADFGKYTKEVANKTKEQQRDVETRLMNDAISRDDDGIVGREFFGLGRVINDGVSVGMSGAALPFSDAQTVIPPDFRTPTQQIYVGALTNLHAGDTSPSVVFGEDQLILMLANRFDNLGQTTELACFCDSLLKRHFSKYFGKYQANVTGGTAIVRTDQEAIAAKRFALFGADLLETDFGPIDINLVSFMPKRSDGTLAGRGYFIDMEAMKIRPSGLWMTHMEIPDGGAGPRGLIQSILGYEYGDPRCHCKVDPATIQTTV